MLRLALLLIAPALAAPTPLAKVDLMIESTGREATAIEAPLAALIDSARAVAASPDARDPVLLLHRDADVIDQRADALARKAEHLRGAVEELVGPILE